MLQAKVKEFAVPLFTFARVCYSGIIICASRNYLEFLQPEESKTTVQSLKSNEEGRLFLPFSPPHPVKELMKLVLFQK